MNRRHLKRFSLLGLLLPGTVLGAADPAIATLAEAFRVESGIEPINVLVVTATHGYRHGPAIDAAKQLLTALNETTEFSFEFTENVADFNQGKLSQFDLLLLANSTLRVDQPTDDAPARQQSAGGAQNRVVKHPVTAAQRAAIVDFLVDGGGLVGAHSALDAFYGWGEYRRLVGGGLFQSHPWTQPVRIVIEEPDNPATAHFGGEFLIKDEIYVLDRNPRGNSHVLASLDTTSVDMEQGLADASRTDFPISWLREHKGTRVFMTKLGHFPEVWTNPAFVQHLLQGMRMAAGRIPVSMSARPQTSFLPAGATSG